MKIRVILENMDAIDVKEFFEARVAILSPEEITQWIDTLPLVLTPEYLSTVLNDHQIHHCLLPRLETKITIQELEDKEREIENWQSSGDYQTKSHSTEKCFQEVGNRMMQLTQLTTQLERVVSLERELMSGSTSNPLILKSMQSLRELTQSEIFQRLYGLWSLKRAQAHPLRLSLQQLQVCLEARLETDSQEKSEEEPAYMTLAYVSFRESDFKKLASIWGLSSGNQAASELVSKYLEKFGLKNKKDLLEAGIFSEEQPSHVEGIIGKLVQYVEKKSRFSIFSFLKIVGTSSNQSRWLLLATSIYEYAVSFGLFLFQWVHHPVTTGLGFIYGIHLNVTQLPAPYWIQKFRIFNLLPSIDLAEGLQIQTRARHLAAKILSILLSQSYMKALGCFYMGINHADSISKHFRSLYYQARN